MPGLSLEGIVLLPGPAPRGLLPDRQHILGNGTQEIFYQDPTVFYFSAHQWPCYPGTGSARETGSAAGHGYMMNCPLPAGSGGVEVLGAVRNKLVPAMRAFRPELVLVSAGFDGREGGLATAEFRSKEHSFWMPRPWGWGGSLK